MEREHKERKKPDLTGQVAHLEREKAKTVIPQFSSGSSPGSCPPLGGSQGGAPHLGHGPLYRSHECLHFQASLISSRNLAKLGLSLLDTEGWL